MSVPVSMFHTRTVLSAPPDKARRPSGEKATANTLSACPPRVRKGLAESRSQTRKVPSQLADRANRPSGERATAVTGWACPSSARTKPTAGSCSTTGSLNSSGAGGVDVCPAAPRVATDHRITPP